MAQPDVVLVHPPSVFDFRERPIFFGPISDVIPSSGIFEMYPVGFLTLAAYLRRHGYRAEIVNLALRMLRSRRFSPEKLLRRMRPSLFGVDLHWLPHVHGALAVAELLKRIHPGIPVVFGGISSTYFHRELIADPNVDFVLRGSVTEPALLALLREVQGDGRFERVPGLTWKGGVNGDAPPCRSLDPYGIDLGMLVSSVVKQLDFWTNVPFRMWWRHPITAVFTVRGCARGCVTCGASCAAFRRFMPGAHPLLRSPEAIAAQIRELADVFRAPIFLVGDLRDGGEEYANAVLDALARTPVANRIVFEFFDPPDAAFVQRVDASVRHWGVELSPESYDEEVRARHGKGVYTNARMEQSIEAMLATRCETLDLFFMTGLPRQTYGSVMATIDAVERLFVRFDPRLSAYVTPMAPFLDPGSDGFEEAEARGYTVRARTLAEHRALLAEARDWESMLNYETRWMTRAEIVQATTDAAARLEVLKARHGRSATLFPAASVWRNFRVRGILRLLWREWVTQRTSARDAMPGRTAAAPLLWERHE